MNIKKIKPVIIAIMVMFLILVPLSQSSQAFLDSFDFMAHGVYSGVGGETDLEGFLGLRLGGIHNNSRLGGQITIAANTFQLGFRQYFDHSELFGGSDIYVEPAVSYRSYSDYDLVTFGGYTGFSSQGTIAADLSLGLEGYSKPDSEAVAVTPVYRASLGLRF